MAKLFVASSDKDSIGNRFRNKRFKFLADKLAKMPKPVSIIDIGGTVGYWELRGLHDNNDFQITLVNLQKNVSPYSNIKVITGDATDMKEFADKSFDIAFSNSVIEHVTLWEKQLAMAREIKRLGTYYFVQTPNRYFPIEPHFMFPFFQFLPYKMQYFILTKTKLSRKKYWKPERAEEYIKEIRLLTTAEMKELFGDCRIYNEKVGGLVKSITVHNFPF